MDEIFELEYNVPTISIAQIRNDFNYMRKKPYDIAFRLVNSNLKTVTVKAHTFVFLARSKWFLRGYRKFLKSNRADTTSFDISQSYDEYFNKTLFNGSQTSYKDGVFTFELENVSEGSLKELSMFLKQKIKKAFFIFKLLYLI